MTRQPEMLLTWEELEAMTPQLQLQLVEEPDRPAYSYEFPGGAVGVTMMDPDACKVWPVQARGEA